MKFATASTRLGFTLAEVLAALVFMAIVIPVAIEALSIASRAGEVAARKSEAVLVAERVLNESIITGQWGNAIQNGTVRQGIHDFRWTMRSEPWNLDLNLNDMLMLSIEVSFNAQGREHSVRLSSLVENTSWMSQTNSTQ